jgi:hypothetical protein
MVYLVPFQWWKPIRNSRREWAPPMNPVELKLKSFSDGLQVRHDL